MTTRQRVLKTVYPVFSIVNRVLNRNKGIFSSDKSANQSFYQLRSVLTGGNEFDFNELRDKKVLIVNTASDCGYTPQYAELEILYQQKKGSLEILAFPANDFMEQEHYEDKHIAAFCSKNYGITFPLMRKSKVVIHSTQNPVFDWLTDKEKNGWNTNQPTWNFCKYLINEEGNLTHFFESSESPLGPNIGKALERKNKG